MRKLKLAIIALTVGVFTSCSDSVGSLSLHSQEDINTAMTSAAEGFSEGDVVGVKINSNDALSSGFGDVMITYRRDGEFYTTSYNGTTYSDPRKAVVLYSDKKVFKNAPAMKVTDFKVDNVVDIFNKALIQVDTDYKDKFNNFALSGIQQKVAKDGGFKTELTIDFREAGSTSKRTGRRVEIEYHDLTVDVNKDGTFKINY